MLTYKPKQYLTHFTIISSLSRDFTDQENSQQKKNNSKQGNEPPGKHWNFNDDTNQLKHPTLENMNGHHYKKLTIVSTGDVEDGNNGGTSWFQLQA